MSFFSSLLSGIVDTASSLIPGGSVVSSVAKGLLGSLSGSISSSGSNATSLANSKELAGYQNELSKDLASYNSELNYQNSLQLMQDQNSLNRQNTLDSASLNKTGLAQAGLSATAANGGYSQNVASAQGTSAGSGSPVQGAAPAFDNFVNVVKGLGQLKNETLLAKAKAKNIEADTELKEQQTNQSQMYTEWIATDMMNDVQRVAYEYSLTDARLKGIQSDIAKNNASVADIYGKLPYEQQRLAASAYESYMHGELSQRQAERIPYEIDMIRSNIVRNSVLNKLSAKQVDELTTVIALNGALISDREFQNAVSQYFGVDATAIAGLCQTVFKDGIDAISAYTKLKGVGAAAAVSKAQATAINASVAE